MDDELLTVSPPIYMVGMKIGCWKCGERMPVVALLAPTVEGAEDEVCVLSDVTAIPEDVLGYVQKRVPTFQFRYSKTVQGKHYTKPAQVAECCPVTSSCIQNRGRRFSRCAKTKLLSFTSRRYPFKGQCAFGRVFTLEPAS